MEYKLLIIVIIAALSTATNCAVLANGNGELLRQALQNNNDKRKNIRICTSKLVKPVNISSQGKIKKITDISSGGIGFQPQEAINEGEIIPVTISYNGIKADTKLQIVFADKDKAGAKFVNTDTQTANKLLLIGIMVEADNGYLITDFKG